MKSLCKQVVSCVFVAMFSAICLLILARAELNLAVDGPGVRSAVSDSFVLSTSSVEGGKSADLATKTPWQAAIRWGNPTALATLVLSTLYLVWLVVRFGRDARLLREGIRQLDCRRVHIEPERLAFRELRDCAKELASIAAQIQAEQGRLTECASRDPLTGLPNRRTMVDRLAQEVATAKRTGWPVSVIMVDLDHFKNLNDTYGHQAGDFVLKRAADRMASQVRQSDTVARFGGEEFAVILPNAGLQEAQEIAQQLRDALRCDLLVIDQHSLRVSASFGVAELHGCGAYDPEALIGLADKALYQAKENGRDTVVTADPVSYAMPETASGDEPALLTQEPDAADSEVMSVIGADTMALMGSTFSLLRLIPDRHRVAHDLAQQVGAILGCRKLSIFLRDPASGRYERAAATGGTSYNAESGATGSDDLHAWIDAVRRAGRLGGERSIEVIEQADGSGDERRALIRIPLAVHDECIGVIEISDLSFDLRITKRQSSLLSAVCLIGATALRNCEQFFSQDLRWTGLVEALCGVIHRDQVFKNNNAVHVSDLSVRIAATLGYMDEENIKTLRLAAMLHDIGEVAIPAQIRDKRGPLRPHERERMQRHCEIGAEMLEGIGGMESLAEIVLCHHEHFDGSGYPSGLAGDRIPLSSRIIAVAAAYRSMISSRPYRSPMPPDVAMARILAVAGTQFDPVVVDAFMICQESDGVVESSRQTA